MEKKETLKDGTKVVIRDLALDDLDKMMKFYQALPEEDRKYLRVDVTNRNTIEKRIKTSKSDDVVRIITLLGDEVIADGALELTREEWRKHQGELRVIVDNKFRHKGLGLIMMRELYHIAVEKKVELIIAKMMRPQVAARTICRKLGFREELMIPDYVRDQMGETQDLIIMACDIDDFWNELDHFYSDSDWQRCR